MLSARVPVVAHVPWRRTLDDPLCEPPHFAIPAFSAFSVGVWIDRRPPKMLRRVLFAAAVAAVAGFATLPPGAKDDAPTFNRVASFYVCTQLDPTCNTDTETVAEIVAVTEDGYTAVYTDSPQGVRYSLRPTIFPLIGSFSRSRPRAVLPTPAVLL